MQGCIYVVLLSLVGRVAHDHDWRPNQRFLRASPASGGTVTRAPAQSAAGSRRGWPRRAAICVLLALAVVGSLGAISASAAVDPGHAALELDACADGDGNASAERENANAEDEAASAEDDAASGCDLSTEELDGSDVDGGDLQLPPRLLETVAERAHEAETVTVHVFDDRLNQERLVDVLERVGVENVNVEERGGSGLENYTDRDTSASGISNRSAEDGIEQFLGDATEGLGDDGGAHVAVGTGRFAQGSSDDSRNGSTAGTNSTATSPNIEQRETDDDSWANAVWSLGKWGASQKWSGIGIFGGSPNQPEHFDGDDIEWEFQDPDDDGVQEQWDVDSDGVPEQFRSESHSGDDPDGYDRNGDGRPDAWDTDGDDQAEVFDTNGDGREDGKDTNGDGRPDQFDVDGDGSVDAKDTDGDGRPDERCQAGECGYSLSDAGQSSDDREPDAGSTDESGSEPDDESGDDSDDSTDQSGDDQSGDDGDDQNGDDSTDQSSDDSGDDNSDGASDDETDGTESGDAGTSSGTTMPEGPGDCGGPAMSCEEPTGVTVGSGSSDGTPEPGECTDDMVCEDDAPKIAEIDGSIPQPGECGPDMVCQTDPIESGSASGTPTPGGCGDAMLCTEPIAPVPTEPGTG